jgi:hypothetical protein
MAGRDCEMLKRKLTQLEVEGCVGAGRGLANTFDERQVKPLKKSNLQERLDAEHAGRELVMKAKVGTFVGIQNRAGDEDDTFWVANWSIANEVHTRVHAHTSTRRCKRGTRRSNSTESKSD